MYMTHFSTLVLLVSTSLVLIPLDPWDRYSDRWSLKVNRYLVSFRDIIFQKGIQGNMLWPLADITVVPCLFVCDWLCVCVCVCWCHTTDRVDLFVGLQWYCPLSVTCSGICWLPLFHPLSILLFWHFHTMVHYTLMLSSLSDYYSLNSSPQERGASSRWTHGKRHNIQEYRLRVRIKTVSKDSRKIPLMWVCFVTFR